MPSAVIVVIGASAVLACLLIVSPCARRFVRAGAPAFSLGLTVAVALAVLAGGAVLLFMWLIRWLYSGWGA